MTSSGKSDRVERVGILGGTFNPPHIAHLVIAEAVRDQLKLDRILFIPAATPPHKTNLEIIPAEQRLQMVKLAIKDNSFFEVSDIELNRKGPSYTIDTIIGLKRELPKEDFYFLLGIDLLVEFDTWKNPEKILEECTLVAMNRPGFDLGVVDKELLRRVEVVNVPSIDISSTGIRRYVKSRRSIRYLVPREVEKYISENSIYR
jgi:nicotinate-nucleotide adenylyltransferase